jgi:hypothetical protein
MIAVMLMWIVAASLEHYRVGMTAAMKQIQNHHFSLPAQVTPFQFGQVGKSAASTHDAILP